MDTPKTKNRSASLIAFLLIQALFLLWVAGGGHLVLIATLWATANSITGAAYATRRLADRYPCALSADCCMPHPAPVRTKTVKSASTTRPATAVSQQPGMVST